MRTRRAMILCLFLQLGIAACAAHGGSSSDSSTEAGSKLPPEVVDVTWQWISLTTPLEQLTVDAPERYAIRFAATGRLEIRADCNRGGAGYTVTEDRGLALGPMALTRMMCPPGSLSDRFAGEVGRASSYFLRAGDLFLELPADSGTLRFRRQP